MSRFFSERFAGLQPYTPGEQPTDKSLIKLNTNEAPYPPAPQVAQALTSGVIDDTRLYGDPNCTKLKQALARQCGVEVSNVFVGNGSDEVLSFCFMAFCDKKVGVSYPDISYGFYSVYAELYGLASKEIPLMADLTIRASDYFNSGSMVVIANPNAPTGLALSKKELEEIAKANPNNVVVIDEAYVDFGGDSCIELTKIYHNLLVVQTFSKSRSFAGGRLGYAIGSPELIEDLEKLRFSTNPYNISSLAAAAGLAALSNQEYYGNNVKRIIQIRDNFILKIKKLGFECKDSKTNFIFPKHPKLTGTEVYHGLRQRGILVRHFPNPRIEDYVRITIGTDEQMEAVLSALKEMVE